MDMRRPLTALAAGIVMIAVLAGCSVNIVDGDKPDSAERTPTTDSSVSEPPDEPSEGPEENPPADDADDADITREQLIDGAATVMRCDGELTILDDAVAVYVEGDCDRLILNSSGSQVVTDDVTTLEVIGDANLVLSGAVDTLLVNGTGNVVHWTGTTPSVTDVGSSNVLKAG